LSDDDEETVGLIVNHQAHAAHVDHRNLWVVDCAATTHMSKYDDAFSEYKSSSTTVSTAQAGEGMHSPGQGTVPIRCRYKGKTTRLDLHDALHTPNIVYNLFSARKLDDAGGTVVIGNGRVALFTDPPSAVINSRAKPFAEGKRDRNLYWLNAEPTDAKPMAAAAKETMDRKLWHRRYGHLHADAINTLTNKKMVTGLTITSPNQMPTCQDCPYGKQTVESFPNKATRRARKVLELVHSDVCGPFPTQAQNGEKYFVSFIDDYSRTIWIFGLRRKSEVFQTFKRFKALAENQTGHRLKAIRTDNAGDYLVETMQDYLADEGIKHEQTVPYSPSQNGVAERGNRTVVEGVRTMLHESGLPKSLWLELAKTAAYLRNRAPMKALDGMTPLEAWSGSKPDVSHLRAIGCKALAHIPKECRNKLQPKSSDCIMVGYDSHHSTYRLYHPASRSIIKARSVTFFENDLPMGPVRRTPVEGEIEAEPTVSPGPINTAPTLDDTATPTDPLPPPKPSRAPRKPIVDPNSAPTRKSSRDRVPSDTLKQTEAYLRHEAAKKETNRLIEEKRRQRREEKTKRNDTQTGDSTTTSTEDHTAHEQAHMALLTHTAFTLINGEPANYREAMKSDEQQEWNEAIEYEMGALEKNGTWKLVPPPDNRKPIGCKWTYRYKFDGNGNITKHRARLVAQGFSQQPGIDFNETHAPVARFESFRIILALAASEDWDIEQVDFKSAYLNGHLDEEIFMQQPEGFEVPGRETWVLRLFKALYGLKQAGRVWNKLLNGSLLDLDFTRCQSDPCVYIRDDEKGKAIIAVHVDDMLLATTRGGEMQRVKAQLHTLPFEIAKLGEPDRMLGVTITRNRTARTISLSQSVYIGKVLSRFNMTDANPISTPLDINIHLSKEQCPTSTEEQAEMSQIPYATAIGALMYAALATRPDIAYAVQHLSQFSSNPGPAHWTAVKRVFRYLKHSQHLALVYTGNEDDPAPIGYSDADWGSNISDRRSTSGFVYFLSDAAVTWSSKKQPTVALSSAEAEYMALAHAAKEAIWLRTLLSELGYPFSSPSPIHCDNHSTITLAKDPTFHARSKHIDIRHHFIRDHIENEDLITPYVATNDNVADILTKGLARPKHDSFVHILGLDSN